MNVTYKVGGNNYDLMEQVGERSQREVIKILLENGCNPNYQVEYHDESVFESLCRTENFDLELLQLFIEKKADIVSSER